MTASGVGALFDSHCHLDFESFADDRGAVIASALEKGVGDVCIPGVEPTQWLSALALDSQTCAPLRVWRAVGVHPWWIDHGEFLLQSRFDDAIAAMLVREDCVAIGECGLDKLRGPDLSRQLEVLDWHQAAAQRAQLPLVLHCVRAHQELLGALKQRPPCSGAVLHGFYGSVELARQYIEAGLYLGIGCTLLRPSAGKLREVVKQVPMDKLLLETDAPAMPATPGERNEPSQLLAVAQCVAELKMLPFDEVARVSRAATQGFYGVA